MKNSKNNIGFKLSVIFILAVTATAALAPLLAPNDPNAADMLLANAAPSRVTRLATTSLAAAFFPVCFMERGYLFFHRY